MGRRRNPTDPPPTRWTRIRPWLFVLALAGVGLGMCYTTRRTVETCEACISLHVVDVNGFGTDPFAPWWVPERLEEVRPSVTCQEFFDGRCEHRWKPYSTQGGVFMFRTFMGGTLKRQPLAWRYDESDPFRSHVVRMLKQGRLTKEDFRAVPSPADLADPERRRLAVLGVTLLREVDGEKEYAVDWENALDPAPAPAPR